MTSQKAATMIPLTDKQIRSSFVNASRREATRAVLPDLSTIDWDACEVLGWRDPKQPLAAYAVVEVDEAPVGLLLRSTESRDGRRRRKVCAWCEDVVVEADVTLYVARRAGPRGRRGDSVGTLICTDFGCSAHARRAPTRAELHSDDPWAADELIRRRVAGLRERSARFVQRVLDGEDA